MRASSRALAAAPWRWAASSRPFAAAGRHPPPRERRQQRDGPREQPHADRPVCAAALAQGDVDDPGQRGQQEQQHRERDRHAPSVRRVELRGLRAVQLVGGGQDHVPHELRGAAEVGLAERQPVAVEGAGGLDEAGVDRQLGRDRRDGPAVGQPACGVDETVGGPRDVVVVPGPHGRRLAAARDVAAGRHRVGVGERAVQLGGVGGQRGDRRAGLLHRRGALDAGQHADQGARQASDDEDGGDPAPPLGVVEPAPPPAATGARAGPARRHVMRHLRVRDVPTSWPTAPRDPSPRAVSLPPGRVPGCGRERTGGPRRPRSRPAHGRRRARPRQRQRGARRRHAARLAGQRRGARPPAHGRAGRRLRDLRPGEAAGPARPARDVDHVARGVAVGRGRRRQRAGRAG